MRLTLALTLTLLSACDDTLFGKVAGEGEGEGEVSGTDWCAVQSIFNEDCVSCHQGSAASGGLNLKDDPYNSLVGVSSSLYAGRTLVVPSDSAGSFLYIKVTGAQVSGEGSAMPIGAGLDTAQSDVIKAWIDAGATEDCTSGGDSGGDSGGGDSGGGDSGGDSGVDQGTHPDGYAEGSVHGQEARLQTLECADCHGADLTGDGDAVSCDACHEDGWRTNCTFCHGGTDNSTGAPPTGIDDTVESSALSFTAHTTHVTDDAYKIGFDCEQCHQTPTDVLTLGHLFVGDESPAVAEVDFTGGLSDAATWDGAGTCSNLYCHGNGQGDNGTISTTATIADCLSCHPHETSGASGWATMSGQHERHLSEGSGFECGDCHKAVVDRWEPITNTSLHVDGFVSVQLVGGMTWSASYNTCDGECHEEIHDERDWYGSY